MFTGMTVILSVYWAATALAERHMDEYNLGSFNVLEITALLHTHAVHFLLLQQSSGT
jgi:hypothetical protein